nr:hypothetical protein [Tanacetum cinerariifolium]
MMNLVPIEEVYVEALLVKHPIIDWKVHSEGQRSYWNITRLGGSSACYQFFIDLLKHLDREDLNQLWTLVKETLSNRPPLSDKEMELLVELNRMYEPDKEDQLWTHTQNFMHALVDWKLYDSCGVHHVAAKDKEIFMLVEKDYPLRKGLALVMICYKLQVENFSRMANELVLKIYRILLLESWARRMPSSQCNCHLSLTGSFFIIAVQTPSSGISILLVVGTPSTGSGNLYYQWELSPGSGISILLVVGTPSTGSGNLYYQWELSPGSGNALCILFPTILPKLDAPSALKFSRIKCHLERMSSITFLV